MSEQNDLGEMSVSISSITPGESASDSILPLVIEPETDASGQLSPGYIIADKYWIQKAIGHGGMAVVHEAQHLRLGERVAIKVMRPALMGIPGMTRRFLQEARAASKVKSDHVCQVLDIDTLPSGLPYIVFEYLDGIDLGALRRKVRPLPISDVIRYVIETCDAIAETHRLGIVHRDLKPSNLFLANWRDGRRIIKVLDFGISKITSANARDITRAGITLGSPHYMSPEQMQPTRDVDERADIWALGAILYCLLAGRPPFTGATVEDVCTQVLLGTPRPLTSVRREVPPELDAIVRRCLRKKPEERFQTADDLACALWPFCEPTTVTTRLARMRSASQSNGKAQPANPHRTHDTGPTRREGCRQAPPASRGPLPHPKRSSGTKLAVVGALCVALVFFGRDNNGGAASARAGEVEETTPVATDAAALVTVKPVAYPWAITHVSANAPPAAVTCGDKQSKPVGNDITCLATCSRSDPTGTVPDPKPTSNRWSGNRKMPPIVRHTNTRSPQTFPAKGATSPPRKQRP